MKTFLMIVLGLVSLILIVSVVFQSGSSKGLSGSITGGAEQLFGKKKAKGYEAVLNKVTIGGSIVFMICALILVALK